MGAAVVIITCSVNSSSGVVLALPRRRESRRGGAKGGEAAPEAQTQQRRQVGAKEGTGEREREGLAPHSYGAWKRGNVCSGSEGWECHTHLSSLAHFLLL